MKLSFDVEPSCTRMRFYRGMIAIQKAIMDFSSASSIQFKHVTDDGVFVRNIIAAVPPDKKTVDFIYDEIYPNSQNNVSDEVYDRKIRKFNTNKYVHHITVLARISANPAQYKPLKMRFFGTMAHLFYDANVSGYKNFVEFYSDDPDVPLSTNDMIAFIVRYVIPHINADDMRELRANRDDVPEVGYINFYIIASDRDVRNPESTEFRFEMSARDDERVKFRVIVLNERLVEVEKGPDGRKTATGEPILSELAFESLKERFKRKFEML